MSWLLLLRRTSRFPVGSTYSLEGHDPVCTIAAQVAESLARKVAVVAAVKGPSRRLAKDPLVALAAPVAAQSVEPAQSPAQASDKRADP